MEIRVYKLKLGIEKLTKLTKYEYKLMVTFRLSIICNINM